MKKILPLLLFVLLAFAGCQPKGPVLYQMTDNPRELNANVEKFVKQTEKSSKHYTAMEWQIAIEQFVAMSKNYVEFRNAMTEEECNRFDAARLQFMKAVETNGGEEWVAEVKEAYAKVMQ